MELFLLSLCPKPGKCRYSCATRRIRSSRDMTVICHRQKFWYIARIKCTTALFRRLASMEVSNVLTSVLHIDENDRYQFLLVYKNVGLHSMDKAVPLFLSSVGFPVLTYGFGSDLQLGMQTGKLNSMQFIWLAGDNNVVSLVLKFLSFNLDKLVKKLFLSLLFSCFSSHWTILLPFPIYLHCLHWYYSHQQHYHHVYHCHHCHRHEKNFKYIQHCRSFYSHQ